MGRGGIDSRILDSNAVGLGGNEFETSQINVPANSTIKKGVVLKRAGDKFVPVTDTTTETPVAVNPFDIQNKTTAAADMSFRALIFGPVRADLLTVGGVVTTNAQNDMLRSYSITPIKANDISRTE